MLEVKKKEIDPGKAKSYVCDDHKIVVCNIDGKYYAVSDICSHDDGELVSGEANVIENNQLECPRHGARFDVRTGESKKMPAVAPIQTFTVIEKEEQLEINV